VLDLAVGQAHDAVAGEREPGVLRAVAFDEEGFEVAARHLVVAVELERRS
jgi:hypothetical protein